MKQICNEKDNCELGFLSDFLRIIAEENRLKIICFLKNNERCVCEIQDFLALPQNLISHHLKVLRDFKLLKFRKDGLKVYYAVNRQVLNRYTKLLNTIINKGEK